MHSTTIRIKENSFNGNIYNVYVIINDSDGFEEEETVNLINPNNPQIEQLLEWYFEQYINSPYDDVKVGDAIIAIEDYGKRLFQNLFIGKMLFRYGAALQVSRPENITIEIVGSSPNFQSIYWESLRDPNQSKPLAALGTVFLRRNTKGVSVRTNVQESATINLLIVTARPNEESDVNYRTIQRPLIDLIKKTAAKVKAHILRPGTYEALVRHLDDKAGHYHIIHFDLHGSLLNYTSYKNLNDAVYRLPTANTVFKGHYALKELKEVEFNNGNKAFIFFESEEKGKAVPVDAEQLADFLEHKQIPICILNACQSAKQGDSAHETSLGRALIQKGIQLVLAMRYSVSVTAATVMMRTLYELLYKQTNVEQAITKSRVELYNNKERRASYNYNINLEDWFLPVIYLNAKPTFKLRQFTPEEEEEYLFEQQIPKEIQQDLSYGFYGRDLDILKIEKSLLVRSNILLLQGMGGAGKTTLLKYLSAWWLQTGLVEKVFYFGYNIKAYSLNEILHHIAKEIYTPYEFNIFLTKSSLVQESNIVAALKKAQFVLIIDNAESITGDKLSIQNTLDKDERSALKNFIKEIKGADSFVIVGSRANEDWLRPGTFENNCYILHGLDPESATDFARNILDSIKIQVEIIVEDIEFKHLLKMLAGYPLALKAILPNLKHKTAKRILSDLERGTIDLDKDNLQQKEESIIKCIEYAYSNMSETAQELLLCLMPFHSIINVHSSVIHNYFEELKKIQYFKNYQIEKFNFIVQEAVQNGFIQPLTNDKSTGIMILQPVFTYFLKNKLSNDNTFPSDKLNDAFINYYRKLGNSLYYYLISTNPKEQQIGLFNMFYEYENLLQVLKEILDLEQAINTSYAVIDAYLNKKMQYDKLLEIGTLVISKLNKYNSGQMTLEIGRDYNDVKYKLGRCYLDCRKYDLAKETYKELLDLINVKPEFFDKPEYNKAEIYQNLGRVADEQKKYSDATDFYEEALAIYTQFEDVEGQAQIHLNLGAIANEQRKYTSGKEHSEKALALFIDIGNIYMQAHAYGNLASNASDRKEFTSAEEYYKKALDIYIQYGDFHTQAQVYRNLGLTIQFQNDFISARKYFEKALNIFIQFGDTYWQAELYQSLGLVTRLQKDYLAAKGYYNKAISILNKKNYLSSHAKIYYNLSLIALDENNYTLAKEECEKALKLFKEVNNNYGCAEVYQNLGVIELCEKDYSLAIEYSNTALNIYKQYKDVHRQGQVYQNLAGIARSQNEYSTSKDYYAKALNIFLQFPEDIKSIVNVINLIYLFAKNINDKLFGQAMIQKALSFFDDIDKAYLQNLWDDLNKI